jgi:hypothetical protein
VTTGDKDAVEVFIDDKGQFGTVSSSARFKEDIKDMAGYSRRLLDLRPVTFRYKQPFADGDKPVEPGLVAEEVAAVYPDLVAYGADGKIETVEYYKLTPMLLNELQHQRHELQALTERLAEARTEIRRSQEALADEDAKLADRLAKLEEASRAATTAAHHQTAN